MVHIILIDPKTKKHAPMCDPPIVGRFAKDNSREMDYGKSMDNLEVYQIWWYLVRLLSFF